MAVGDKTFQPQIYTPPTTPVAKVKNSGDTATLKGAEKKGSPPSSPEINTTDTTDVNPQLCSIPDDPDPLSDLVCFSPAGKTDKSDDPPEIEGSDKTEEVSKETESAGEVEEEDKDHKVTDGYGEGDEDAEHTGGVDHETDHDGKISPEITQILDFIHQIDEQNVQALLDAIENSLKHWEKIMQENMKDFYDKVKPKLEKVKTLINEHIKEHKTLQKVEIQKYGQEIEHLIKEVQTQAHKQPASVIHQVKQPSS